jgi:hypothetical protein
MSFVGVKPQKLLLHIKDCKLLFLNQATIENPLNYFNPPAFGLPTSGWLASSTPQPSAGKFNPFNPFNYFNLSTKV